MPYWWDYDDNVANAQTGAIAVTERQLQVLYRHAPEALDERARRTWAPLLAAGAGRPIPNRQRPAHRSPARRRRQRMGVDRFARAVGLAAGALISVTAARLAYLALGADGTWLPLMVGALTGEGCGLVIGRLFVSWAAQAAVDEWIGG